ncbi:hypothetical protein AXW37_15015 [Yersinia ruckeri]|nr:hypothetical protein AXW22_14860 [Yersinia ruckeri]OJB67980.1 hypothetical protein A9Q65_14715 [Yersinia ruckeri]OJB69468.1 hypothetical protein A9Q64_14750 [Yersinia ruckeri]OJB71270.1 hypothetical protein A9Q63_14725 [Yersinia ruckeri]OJB83925.1 hypothetical protein A9Q61_15435 [Yersinia ruckeri]
MKLIIIILIFVKGYRGLGEKFLSLSFLLQHINAFFCVLNYILIDCFDLILLFFFRKCIFVLISRVWRYWKASQLRI